MAPRTPGRIMLPNTIEGTLQLGKSIYEKHKTDAASSVLNAQQDYNWDDDGPKVAACLQNHNLAEEHSRLAEQYYRERDKDLPAIEANIKNSSQLLKSIYAKNPKKLGEYGFVVDDTPQEPKKPKQ